MALSFLPRWKAAPVPLRVVVRARDAAAFIERYREHVDGDRIFIFTRMAPCAGTRVRFQIHLATGDCVLRGEGTVVRALPEGPAQAGGMELKFVATDEASRALVSAMRAPRRDGVPVAGPAPRRAERGTPAAAVEAVGGDRSARHGRRRHRLPRRLVERRGAAGIRRARRHAPLIADRVTS